MSYTKDDIQDLLKKIDQVVTLVEENADISSYQYLATEEAIHKKIFGFLVLNDCVVYLDPKNPQIGLTNPIQFMRTVEAAEQLLPGPQWPEWQLTRRYTTGYHASVGLGNEGVGMPTPALALCVAALQNRLSEFEEKE